MINMVKKTYQPDTVCTLTKHGMSVIHNQKLNIYDKQYLSFAVIFSPYFSVSSANKMVSRVSLWGAAGGPAAAPAPKCSDLLVSGARDPIPASESLDKVLSALSSPDNERRDGLKPNPH